MYKVICVSFLNFSLKLSNNPSETQWEYINHFLQSLLISSIILCLCLSKRSASLTAPMAICKRSFSSGFWIVKNLIAVVFYSQESYQAAQSWVPAAEPSLAEPHRAEPLNIWPFMKVGPKWTGAALSIARYIDSLKHEAQLLPGILWAPSASLEIKLTLSWQHGYI